MKLFGFSVILIPEGRSYSAWCPEVDVASQGDTPKEAISNLKEALQLHLECLSQKELQEIRKRKGAKFVTTIKIQIPA